MNITTRSQKGSPLTFEEMDQNWEELATSIKSKPTLDVEGFINIGVGDNVVLKLDLNYIADFLALRPHAPTAMINGTDNVYLYNGVDNKFNFFIVDNTFTIPGYTFDYLEITLDGGVTWGNAIGDSSSVVVIPNGNYAPNTVGLRWKPVPGFIQIPSRILWNNIAIPEYDDTIIPYTVSYKSYITQGNTGFIRIGWTKPVLTNTLTTNDIIVNGLTPSKVESNYMGLYIEFPDLPANTMAEVTTIGNRIKTLYGGDVPDLNQYPITK